MMCFAFSRKDAEIETDNSQSFTSQLATIATFSHLDVQCSFASCPHRKPAPHSPTISDTRWKASPALSLRMGRTAKIVRYLHAFWEAGSNSTCRRQLNNTYNTASKQKSIEHSLPSSNSLLSAVSQSFLVSWPVMQRTLLKVDTRVILC
ncbi:hypothetical protein BLNAU_22690 [Blattamonas nauphoetae]|uniref:Transposase n=1 Tax=Blattamonas nauphoetae TaxID=2049346 RepID=A0ABQ9WPP9_9EUKA|nr:hypothetical protein BLNAU_23628 [Blattamonas nauphoetae]KAK2942402.1 hypothetical protein BLNAU_22690 [Blattamonas nauphoetae]